MNSVDEVKISDKCKRYRVNIEQEGEQQVPGVDLLEKHIPIQGSHGDMVIIGEKALRSLNVYFINVIIEEDENECKKVVRKLVQTDNTGSGYCCVPLEVTRKIDDPLKFYENSFTFDEYDEIDFSGIEIDTVEHQHVIKRFTNGKEVAPNRKCFYFFLTMNGTLAVVNRGLISSRLNFFKFKYYFSIKVCLFGVIFF